MLKKYLIIDDSSEIRDVIREALLPTENNFLKSISSLFGMSGGSQSVEEKDTVQVFEAHSGELGVSLAKKERACGQGMSVIFVDMHMPGGINGLDTIRQLREFETEAKIVFATGDASAASFEELALANGGEVPLVIYKPFSAGDIKALLGIK